MQWHGILADYLREISRTNATEVREVSPRVFAGCLREISRRKKKVCENLREISRSFLRKSSPFRSLFTEWTRKKSFFLGLICICQDEQFDTKQPWLANENYGSMFSWHKQLQYMLLAWVVLKCTHLSKWPPCTVPHSTLENVRLERYNLYRSNLTFSGVLWLYRSNLTFSGVLWKITLKTFNEVLFWTWCTLWKSGVFIEVFIWTWCALWISGVFNEVLFWIWCILWISGAS